MEMIIMAESTREILSSILSNGVIQSFFTAFLGGFVVYFFTTRQKLFDRRNDVDDSLVKRRLEIYKEVEELVSKLTEWEIVPSYTKECAVLDLKLNGEMIIYTHPLYSDIEQVKVFDKSVMKILNQSYLLDYDILNWIWLLHMYNDNMIVLYEGVGEDIYNDFTKIILSAEVTKADEEKVRDLIRIKYFALLAFYDIGMICRGISKAVKRFYSSKNKLKFKKGRINLSYFITNERTFRLNARYYLVHNNNMVNKIIRTCLFCTNDCKLAGKLKKKEIVEKKENAVKKGEKKDDSTRAKVSIKQKAIELKVGITFLCLLGLLMGAIVAGGIVLFKTIVIDNYFSLQGMGYGIVIAFFIVIILIMWKAMFKGMYWLKEHTVTIRFPYFFFVGMCIALAIFINNIGFFNDVLFGVIISLLISHCFITFVRVLLRNNAGKNIVQDVISTLENVDIN